MSEFTHRSSDSCSTLVPSILRIGVAGCFIGHGAFGIITKAAWVPYFGVAGISETWAWKLMPPLGAMDICMGCLVLLWPCRTLFLWAAAWATWTALLRPLSGESSWEFLERAGNFGVPIAILTVVGLHQPWFTRLSSTWSFDENVRRRLAWTLRATTATLLAGHAGCAFFLRKAVFAQQYSLFGGSAALTPWVGAFEFALSATALLFPRPALLFALCGWKVATEFLFPLSGAPIWELVERFGSYTAPLALGCLLLSSPLTEKTRARSFAR